MQIGIVKGQIVSTKKTDRLQGIKILVVQPFEIESFQEKGNPFASLDNIGAGEGDVVMVVGGSSARQTDVMSDKPTDSTIVAILDSVDILGKRVFDKSAYEKTKYLQEIENGKKTDDGTGEQTAQNPQENIVLKKERKETREKPVTVKPEDIRISEEQTGNPESKHIEETGEATESPLVNATKLQSRHAAQKKIRRPKEKPAGAEKNNFAENNAERL